ncbi:MAG: amidohydrolase family protein [Deltaproteobacteria bacterium]|jgi:N-acyl-D-aspartate/D-glutamate deacylase|nr:amidohydrolase family protein [Deltaproteobacteria bacterium]
MYDALIRGGELVDGTGRARRRADLGILNGRIAAIGTDLGEALHVMDASGRIVSPGFVDIHSHFDAQVFWDTALTPSSLYGVTTTISGNCGFTLAPLSADALDYLVRMLAIVEGMPLESLRACIDGDWSSTAELLDRVDGTLAINLGFLVGHSAIRRVTMGKAATRRSATGEERTAMDGLLRAGLEAGGLGFSSSWSPSHLDGDGDPVPSTFADASELIDLASVCRDFDGTSLEFIPKRVDRFDAEQLDLLLAMSARAERALNWNVIRVTASNGAETERVLSAGHRAGAEGARIVALAMPIASRAHFSFATGFVLNALPGWRETFSLPIPARIEALRSTRVRRELEEGARRAQGPLGEMADWSNRVISQTFDPGLEHYAGRSVSEIAKEEGKSTFDALLDIACADELRTTFTRPPSDPSRDDWKAFAAAVREGHAVIGASDAGAHLDFIAYYDYPAYLLERGVREHGVFSLEEAIHLMTEVPARLYGLRDRGTLEVGSHADVVVFDADEIASGRLETRFDLPSGAGRLYSEPRGVDRVLVNGEEIVSEGVLTNARPGTLLRSGRDTTSPSLA